MKYRTLGKGMEVSVVGLGCMGFSHAYGAATERSEAVRAIQQAAELDQAPVRLHRLQDLRTEEAVRL